MAKTIEKIEEEAFAFAEGASYEELIQKQATMKYDLSRLEKEYSGDLMGLVLFQSHIPDSVRYHVAMSHIMEVDRRLDKLGKDESKKGYSDKYGLRKLYEQGGKTTISNATLDANGRILRSRIDSGGRVMAKRRTDATGMSVRFKTKKTEYATSFWFERSEKKSRF